MVFRVGLTGGIASGKSTVSQLFATHGIDIIDADIISRELCQPGKVSYHAIVEQFGKQFLLEDGQLNRPALRELIFSEPQARQQLENILHPAIRQQMFQQSEISSSPYCILVIPLLIEAKMQSSVDRILVVDVDNQSQLSRLQKRDNLSATQAMQQIAAQLGPAQRLQYADDIIDNSAGNDSLKFQVSQLHALYCQLAEAKKRVSESEC